MGAVMEFVNPVLVVLSGVSLPVKVAWGVWLVWGVAQLAWYFWPSQESRIYRTTTAAPPAWSASGPRTAAVRSPKKVAPAAVAPYGTSDFIAALDQEQKVAGDASAPVAPDSSSAYR